MLPSSAPTIDALHRPQHEAEAYGQGGEWAAQPRQDKEGQVPAPVVVPSTAHYPHHTPPQAPTGMVGLRLAALPMDQYAARMLNLARLSSVTPPSSALPTHTAAEPPTNNNTTNGPQRDAHTASYTTRPFLFSSLAAYPNHMERIVRLCAPVACAALHGVGGLAWAPALVLLCLWRGNALPPSLLTLVGTALALTTRESSTDALLCFAWTTLGGALVVGQIGGWIAQVAGATASVLWLASLVVVSPAWGGNNNDWARATLLAIRAIAYELLCLCTTPKASPAECWARYGALLTCASAAPLLAGSLTLLGVALLWTQRALWVNGNKATASDADLHLPPDALDVQEAFRRARAQYYLSGSAQPPSSIEKNA